MSLISFISDIKSKIFGSNNKRQIIGKVTPIFNNEYVPDLEAGEGLFYKRLMARQQALDPDTRLYYDLEVGDKSVIIIEREPHTNIGERRQFIEKYLTYVDVIHYFGWKNGEEDENYQAYSLSALRSCSKTHKKIPVEHIDFDILDEMEKSPNPFLGI